MQDERQELLSLIYCGKDKYRGGSRMDLVLPGGRGGRGVEWYVLTIFEMICLVLQRHF